MTEVIAEVTYGSTKKWYRWGRRVQVIDFHEIIDHIKGIATYAALFSTPGKCNFTAAGAEYQERTTADKRIVSQLTRIHSAIQKETEMLALKEELEGIKW